MATNNADNNNKRHPARLASFNESGVPTLSGTSSAATQASSATPVSGATPVRISPLSFLFGRSRTSTENTLPPRPRASTRESPFSFFYGSAPPDYVASDKAALNAYMQSHRPETSPQRLLTTSRDPHFSLAIETPDKYADLLIRVANLDKIKTSDNIHQLLNDTLISRIRAMMIPELITTAVKRRPATYLLGLAQSPCTSEWIKTTERTLQNYTSILEDPQAGPEDKAPIEPLMSSFLLNIATVLLDGIDIANWDNFAWDIPTNILQQRGDSNTEAPAVARIRNVNLRPLNVKNSETARRRFPACGAYFRAHTAASAPSGGRKTRKARTCRTTQRRRR